MNTNTLAALFIITVVCAVALVFIVKGQYDSATMIYSAAATSTR